MSGRAGKTRTYCNEHWVLLYVCTPIFHVPMHTIHRRNPLFSVRVTTLVLPNCTGMLCCEWEYVYCTQQVVHERMQEGPRALAVDTPIIVRLLPSALIDHHFVGWPYSHPEGQVSTCPLPLSSAAP